MKNKYFDLIEQTFDFPTEEFKVIDDELYFNRRDIEESISVGDYNLYIDYSENVYLELNITTTEEITQSFW